MLFGSLFFLANTSYRRVTGPFAMPTLLANSSIATADMRFAVWEIGKLSDAAGMQVRGLKRWRGALVLCLFWQHEADAKKQCWTSDFEFS